MRGSLGELADAASGSRVTDGAIPARGEFVLVVGAWAVTSPTAEDDQVAALEAAQREVEALVGSGVARGEAARRVAAATGLPRRRLYGGDPSR